MAPRIACRPMKGVGGPRGFWLTASGAVCQRRSEGGDASAGELNGRRGREAWAGQGVGGNTFPYSSEPQTCVSSAKNVLLTSGHDPRQKLAVPHRGTCLQARVHEPLPHPILLAGTDFQQENAAGSEPLRCGGNES